MEHRCGPRRPAYGAVIVHHGGRRWGRYWVRNASQGGLFVEPRGGSPPLPVGRIVELSCEGPQGPRRLRALVVHSGPRGAGSCSSRRRRPCPCAPSRPG